MTIADTPERLEDLKAKLAARTKSDGNPQKGYGRNVQALKAEIARLETVLAAQTTTSADPVDKPAAAEHVEAPKTPSGD